MRFYSKARHITQCWAVKLVFGNCKECKFCSEFRFLLQKIVLRVIVYTTSVDTGNLKEKTDLLIVSNGGLLAT